MDPQISTPIFYVCQKHNSQKDLHEVFQKKWAFCVSCIQEKIGGINADQYTQKLNAMINKEEENQVNNRQFCENIYNTILNYKYDLIFSLDQILQLISDQIKIIDENQLYFEDPVICFFETLQMDNYRQQERNNDIKNQVKQLLDQFQKQYFNSKQLFELIERKPQSIINEFFDWKKFEYEVIKQSIKTGDKSYNAFAFNQESNILVAASNMDIIVYQFVDGVITQELQTLTKHSDNVYCLHFMKKSNSFASGSQDHSIIIWEFDYSQSKWFAKQLLNDHKDRVNCILMNQREDLLVSSSSDTTIKFWKKVKKLWICQQSIETKDIVYDISLNDLEDKLIACQSQTSISFMQKGSDNQWSLVQSIKVKSFGSRVCFTTGDQFIYQLGKGKKLQVYDYDQKKKQFYIRQKVQIEYHSDSVLYFPCQYIKQLRMLAVKHDEHLNIFKINQGGHYQLIYSVKMLDGASFGRLTGDGQYLLTWDFESKIKVRNLYFLY